MIKRTVPFLVLAALVLPTTAAAEKNDIQGPLKIAGKGFLRGELKMASPSETRPVQIAGKGGFVRFVDLGGDLKVQCQGAGKSRTHENDEGQTVVMCMGRGGRAKAHGSHFRLVLFAHRYRAAFPEGVTGTLSGRYRSCEPGASADSEDGEAPDQAQAACGQLGNGQAQDRKEQLKERAEQLKERGEESKDRREQLKDRAAKLKERAEKLKERTEKLKERAKERGDKQPGAGSGEQGNDDKDEDDDDESVPSVAEVAAILASADVK